MRYADGPIVECDIHVAAEPARVWQVVTDISVPAQFSPELRRTRWLDDQTGPSLGARFEGHNHHPALGEWRTISQVVQCDPPHVFGWAVLDPDGRFGGGLMDLENPGATWQFRLAAEDGGCRLTHSVRIGPGRTGLNIVIDRAPEQEEAIIEQRLAALREGMDLTLRGIKDLAEVSTPTGPTPVLSTDG